MAFIFQDYTTHTLVADNGWAEYNLPFRAVVGVEFFDYDRVGDAFEIRTPLIGPDYKLPVNTTNQAPKFSNGNPWEVGPVMGVFAPTTLFRLFNNGDQLTVAKLHIFRLPEI